MLKVKVDEEMKRRKKEEENKKMCKSVCANILPQVSSEQRDVWRRDR